MFFELACVGDFSFRVVVVFLSSEKGQFMFIINFASIWPQNLFNIVITDVSLYTEDYDRMFDPS